MSQQWYYSLDGQKLGPVSPKTLRELCAAGTIRPVDLVWTEGLKEWRQARTIKGLFSLSSVQARSEPPASPPAEPSILRKPEEPTAEAVEDGIERLPVSDAWKRRFRAIEEDPTKFQFNWWAFFLGPFYYAAQGLWKKGVVLTGAGVLVSTLIEIMASAFGWKLPAGTLATPAGGLCAAYANRDVYRKVVFGEYFWPQLKRIEAGPKIVALALAVWFTSSVISASLEPGPALPEIDSPEVASLAETAVGASADDKPSEKEPIRLVDRVSPNDSGHDRVVSSKWGFVDPTGRLIISCQFDKAKDFDQGLAAVMKAGKWGWIDRHGQTRISMEFEDVGWYRDGRAPVKRGGKWGYVDGTGRVVIDCLYEECSHFEDGLARVTRDGKNLYIDVDGTPSIPRKPKPRVLVVGHGAGARFGFEDAAGRIIVNPQFDSVSDFTESNVAVVNAGDSSGIVDMAGRWVVPLQSRYGFQAFPKTRKLGAGMRFTSSEGLFGYQDNREMREGYVKETGEIVIPAQFADATAFSEGLACVTPTASLSELERTPEGAVRNPTYGRAGYIDTMGRFVIPPQFSRGHRFSEGLAAVKVGIEGGQWGFIDKSGEFIIRPGLDHEPSDFSGGYAIVNKGNLYGFIDKQGNLAVSHQFAEASDFAEGLARVQCP